LEQASCPLCASKIELVDYLLLQGYLLGNYGQSSYMVGGLMARSESASGSMANIDR